jgi:hypothetical protein
LYSSQSINDEALCTKPFSNTHFLKITKRAENISKQSNRCLNLYRPRNLHGIRRTIRPSKINDQLKLIAAYVTQFIQEGKQFNAFSRI